MENNFEFFYGGPFSQWFPCRFTIKGVTYNCAEQYMMAQKALFFADIDAHIKIMATDSPSKQKAIGRTVKGFNVPAWNTVCKKIVYDANYAKFTQNENLKEYLLDTENKEIVEASPYDVIWGIGLPEGHPDITDKTKWRGMNWLGETIMMVRETIRLETFVEKTEHEK
jgi:ribA/ribD-fused uncharacterized protein